MVSDWVGQVGSLTIIISFSESLSSLTITLFLVLLIILVILSNSKLILSLILFLSFEVSELSPPTGGGLSPPTGGSTAVSPSGLAKKSGVFISLFSLLFSSLPLASFRWGLFWKFGVLPSVFSLFFSSLESKLLLSLLLSLLSLLLSLLSLLLSLLSLLLSLLSLLLSLLSLLLSLLSLSSCAYTKWFIFSREKKGLSSEEIISILRGNPVIKTLKYKTVLNIINDFFNI